MVARGDLSGGTILTAKLDAFGGRIGDVLNGWRLATALGARFRFYWPVRAVPGIVPAPLVFDAEFLAQHLVEQVDLSGRTPVAALRMSDLRSLRDGGTLLLATKSDVPGRGRFTVGGRGFDIPGLMSMGEAFARLPLAPELDGIRTWSRDVAPFDAAVHVRRGDVFAGDYRLGGHFAAKAIPLPLVERIVAAVGDGGSTLVVGEDPAAVIRRLGAGVHVLAPGAFPSPHLEHPVGAVFRDFCLLARARRIVAGKSVFALIPARIAGIDPTPPEAVVPAGELGDLLLEFVRRSRGGGDLEVALACEYLRVRTPVVAARAEEELLRAAHEADPENPVYPLRLAAERLRLGDRRGAAELLDAAAAAGAFDLMLRLLGNDLDVTRGVGLAYIWGGYLRTQDLQVLRGALGDIPWCAFVSATEHAAEGDFAAARRDLHATGGLTGHPAVEGLARLLSDPPARIPSRRGGSLITPSLEEGVA